jgi:hypothetical protein
MDAPRFARGVEAADRRMGRRWCEQATKNGHRQQGWLEPEGKRPALLDIPCGIIDIDGILAVDWGSAAL